MAAGPTGGRIGLVLALPPGSWPVACRVPPCRHPRGRRPVPASASSPTRTARPVVALLRLMHLRIPLPGGVLGRVGRGDDPGVHDAAPRVCSTGRPAPGTGASRTSRRPRPPPPRPTARTTAAAASAASSPGTRPATPPTRPRRSAMPRSSRSVTGRGRPLEGAATRVRESTHRGPGEGPPASFRALDSRASEGAADPW